MIEYTYVFVRMNMLPVQIAVQACHAVLEMAKGIKWDDVGEHPHLLLLGVDNEHELEKVWNIFCKNRRSAYRFQEPDMNNSWTAIASEPIEEKDEFRNKLKKYKLLPLFIHNKV